MREMGQGMFVMPAKEGPEENEVPTEIGGTRNSMRSCK